MKVITNKGRLLRVNKMLAHQKPDWRLFLQIFGLCIFSKVKVRQIKDMHRLSIFLKSENDGKEGKALKGKGIISVHILKK